MNADWRARQIAKRLRRGRGARVVGTNQHGETAGVGPRDPVWTSQEFASHARIRFEHKRADTRLLPVEIIERAAEVGADKDDRLKIHRIARPPDLLTVTANRHLSAWRSGRSAGSRRNPLEIHSQRRPAGDIARRMP